MSCCLALQVYLGQLFGSQPVAVKVLDMTAFRPPPVATPAAAPPASSGLSLGLTQSAVAARTAAAAPAAVAERALEAHLLRLWREVDLLHRCTHPNVVQLLGVYSSCTNSSIRRQQHLMLVTELLEGGSLQARLPEPALRWYRR